MSEVLDLIFSRDYTSVSLTIIQCKLKSVPKEAHFKVQAEKCSKVLFLLEVVLCPVREFFNDIGTSSALAKNPQSFKFYLCSGLKQWGVLYHGNACRKTRSLSSFYHANAYRNTGPPSSLLMLDIWGRSNLYLC